MELLKSLTGTKLVHVPYRGDAPALNDLVAGHIPTQFAQPTPVLPLLQAEQGARARDFIGEALRPDGQHPDHCRVRRARFRFCVLADDRCARRNAESRSSTGCTGS